MNKITKTDRKRLVDDVTAKSTSNLYDYAIMVCSPFRFNDLRKCFDRTPDDIDMMLEMVSSEIEHYNNPVNIRTDKAINKMAKEVLMKDARAECVEIMSRCSVYRYDELVKYYKEDKHNIFCMHLDLVKVELIHYGLMVMKHGDKFGNLCF